MTHVTATISAEAPSAERRAEDALAAESARALLARQAQSRRKEERQAAAAHPQVPLGVQALLANDDWHAVRAAVARNPVAARSVMENLASDKHREVVLALLANPKVPFDIVERLAFDKRPEVRQAASARLDAAEPPEMAPVARPDALIPELRERAEVFVPHHQSLAPTAAHEAAQLSDAEARIDYGTFMPREEPDSPYAPPEWLYAELPPIVQVPGPYVAAPLTAGARGYAAAPRHRTPGGGQPASLAS